LVEIEKKVEEEIKHQDEALKAAEDRTAGRFLELRRRLDDMQAQLIAMGRDSAAIDKTLALLQQRMDFEFPDRREPGRRSGAPG
jgi:hypothetical protein